MAFHMLLTNYSLTQYDIYVSFLIRIKLLWVVCVCGATPWY